MQHKSIYFPIRQSGCVGKCMNYFNSLNCPETPCSERGGGGRCARRGWNRCAGFRCPKTCSGAGATSSLDRPAVR